jgi:hypothetical protein
MILGAIHIAKVRGSNMKKCPKTDGPFKEGLRYMMSWRTLQDPQNARHGV